MAKLEVLTAPDPILKKKAIAVESVDDSVRKLMDDMLETMYEDRGVGLAAIITPYLESILKDVVKLIPAGILSNIELPTAKDINKDGVVDEMKKKAVELNSTEDLHLEENIKDFLPAKE